MKKNYKVCTLMLLSMFALVGIIAVIASVYRPVEKPEPSLKQSEKADYERLFEEAVNCAALMAATESVTKGKLQAGSNIFNLVSYTLGMAQEHAQNAKLDISKAKSLYDTKTIGYFMQLSQASEEELASNNARFKACVAQARHYNPATMLDAAMEDVKENNQ